MSKSDTWEDGMLDLLFNNTTFTEVGDGAGLLKSAADGDLWLTLHTADPGEAGTQLTSETAYTNYVRVAVNRTNGWTASSGGQVFPAADIDFAECGAVPGAAVSYFGIGTLTSGVGKLLYSGLLSPSVTMALGVIPRIKSTSSITEQ